MPVSFICLYIKNTGLYKYDTVLCYLFFSDQEEKNKFLYEKLIVITEVILTTVHETL